MTPNDGRGREENTASSSSVAATATALALDDLDKGILPILPGDSELDGNYPKQQPATNAATGASAASVRALTSQAIAFYFRAPVKAFFRTRVDYLAYARALQELRAQQAAAAASPAPPSSSATELRSGSPASSSTSRTIASTLSGQGVGPASTAAAAAALGSGSSSSSSSASSSPPSRPGTAVSHLLHWLSSRARASTPGVLASAVRHLGWRVVPDQVLPPLIANVGVGAVLYTSYLQVLGRLHEGSARGSRRVYPPPQPLDTFAAGFLAGSIQSVVAAPLDAVQARYDLGTSSAAGMTASGNPVPAAAAQGPKGTSPPARPQSMWAFSYAKLREIGVRGIFAGWGLSFLKDSFGCAVFFSTFECIKAQGFYRFVTWYYGSLNEDTVVLLSRKRPSPSGSGRARQGPSSNSDGGDDSGGEGGMPIVVKPHYAIEPAFLLLAGIGASVAQQVILHPLSHIQVEHWERLEWLDAKARKIRLEKGEHNNHHPATTTATATAASARPKRWRMMRAYYRAYQETWRHCLAEAEASGLTMRRWLFRGFWWNTIRQVPSTSAGLVIFELVRRKYGFEGDPVRINRDGYDILLH